MKRSHRCAISAVLALCGVLFLVFALAACGESETSGEETVENYGYVFQYTMRTYGRVKLGFERGAVEESGQDAIAEQLYQAYGALRDALGNGAVATVFVLSDPRAAALPGCVYWEQKLYVKRSAIKSGEFLTYFSAAFLGEGEPWKAIAARAAAFGKTSEISDAELKEYLSEEGHLALASLFAAYYSEAFSTEEERAYAVAAAEKFGAFELEKRGRGVLFRVESEEDKAEFLRTLGVEADGLPSLSAWRLDAEYSTDDAYPLVISAGTRRYYLAPVSGGAEKEAFDTPAAVLSVLSDGNEAADEILQTIKEQAPDAYREVQKRVKETLTYYISPAEEPKTDVESGTVHLSDPGAFVRETARAITGSSGRKLSWLEEGLAFYFSEFVTHRFGAEQRAVFTALTLPEADFEGDDLAFLQAVKARCTEQGDPVSDPASYRHARVLEAIAYVTLLHPAYRETVSFPWAVETVGEKLSLTAAEGNDLTLPEAYLLAKYAVARLGMDAVLTASMSGDITGLGTTYPVLRAALQSEAEAGVTTWAPKLPDTSGQALQNDLMLFVFVGISAVLAVAVVLFFTRKRR